jgi:hypothetical protein
MNEIIIPNKDIIESLRCDPDARYAAMHPVESHIGLHGIWQCDHYRQGNLISGGYPEPPNTFTIEGMARLLNIIFHDIQKAASEIWYVGIYKNNVTPNEGNTAEVCLGAAGTYLACQDADYNIPATNCPAYTTADTAIASITNSATQKAEFTAAAVITIHGSYLTTIQAKTGTSGFLMSAKRFAASRPVQIGDELAVAYTISLTTS